MPTTTYQIRLRDEIINLSDLDISLTIQVRNPTITKPARDGEILPHYYDKYNESIYIVEFSAPEKYKMGTFRIYAKPGAILYWELEELKHKYYPFHLVSILQASSRHYSIIRHANLNPMRKSK